MSEHFTKARAIHLIDIIKQYWRGYGKHPKLEAVSDHIAGWVVRSNMVGGKPVNDDRPIYIPQVKVKLNKRLS